MQIYIMRHGQAEDYATADAQRALTKHGIDEVQTMAIWFRQANRLIEQVLVSPYLRAQQTASTLVESANFDAAQETLPIITPAGNAKEVHDYIDGIIASKNLNSILLISHMPLVSYLVGELSYEEQSPIFQTASVAHINYDRTKMKGELLSITSPNEIKPSE